MVETIVAIFVIGVLAFFLALPAISPIARGCGQTQMLLNMKQLHLATQQMALDSVTTGDTNLGWPGDMDGSFTRWATEIAKGSYLATNDLCKLLSAQGKIVSPTDRIPTMNASAVLVYAVTKESPPTAVIFTSANFTNSPTGGSAPTADAKPYGNKGFVVFRKAGDGDILQARFAGQTNLIGGYVPLCR